MCTSVTPSFFSVLYLFLCSEWGVVSLIFDIWSVAPQKRPSWELTNLRRHILGILGSLTPSFFFFCLFCLCFFFLNELSACIHRPARCGAHGPKTQKIRSVKIIECCNILPWKSYEQTLSVNTSAGFPPHQDSHHMLWAYLHVCRPCCTARSIWAVVAMVTFRDTQAALAAVKLKVYSPPSRCMKTPAALGLWGTGGTQHNTHIWTVSVIRYQQYCLHVNMKLIVLSVPIKSVSSHDRVDDLKLYDLIRLVNYSYSTKCTKTQARS